MNKLLTYMNLASRYAEGLGELPIAIYLREQHRILERVINGEEYIAATYYVPNEILSQFDIPVLYIERISGFGAANKLLGNIDIKRQYLGMPSCSCTYQIYYEGLIDECYIPHPSRIIASSFACDDAWWYCNKMSQRYKTDIYLIDVFRSNSEEAELYISKQLYELDSILKINYKTVRSLDSIIEQSNEGLEIKAKIDSVRKNNPGILDSNTALKLFPLYNDLGKPYANEIMQTLYDLLLIKAAHYEPENKIRLIWLGMIPLYYNNLIKDIEERYNCRIVYEELFQYPNKHIDKRNIYHSISKRIMNTHFFTMQQRMRDIIEYIDTYNVDGIIHFSQKNCRFLPPMLPLVYSELSEYKIPIVDINGDVADPSGFSDTIWDKLDAFFEILNRRKKDVSRNVDCRERRINQA